MATTAQGDRAAVGGYLPVSLRILDVVGRVFFRIELLLQSQRPEVEKMIQDMGVGQSAIEQLAVYCVSLKKCVLPLNLHPTPPHLQAKSWHLSVSLLIIK